MVPAGMRCSACCAMRSSPENVCCWGGAAACGVHDVSVSAAKTARADSGNSERVTIRIASLPIAHPTPGVGLRQAEEQARLTQGENVAANVPTEVFGCNNCAFFLPCFPRSRSLHRALQTPLQRRSAYI